MNVRRTRRVIFSLVFWLAIGAAISVAISWAIAAWMPNRPWSRTTHIPVPLDFNMPVVIDEYRGLGWMRRCWDITSEFEEPIKLNDLRDCITASPSLALSTTSYNDQWTSHWGNLRDSRQVDRSTPHQGCEHATGWPCFSFWYALDGYRRLSSRVIGTAIGPSAQVHHGIRIPWNPPSGIEVLADIHALPLHPIARGIVMNTVFWGAASWTVFTLIRLGIARRRAMRGLCPRCAYNLSASPTTCPECGWNRTPLPTQT